MDYYRRNQNPRPRIRLQRDVDGRLRPAVPADGDIGGIWAEQRRIRLAQAIEEDRRKAEKRKKIAIRPKEIAFNFNISLPKIKLPKVPPAVLLKIPKKQWLILGAISVSLVVLGAIGYGFFGGDEPDAGRLTKVESLNPDNQPKVPQYNTVLPKGKDIRALGGWARVSPPDKDPVFAYADTIGNIHISVSQQPLPEAFKKDVGGSVASLARDFNANEKLTVGGTPVYVGTSIRGPQSVVFAKGDLLVLIKASGTVPDQSWADYIASLE